jgi:carboxyl-terminal processing protease
MAPEEMIEWEIALKRIPMARIRVALLAVLAGACLVLLLGRTAVGPVSASSAQAKGPDLLEQVINLIRDHYLEEKDPVQTMDGSFRGLVNSLDAGCAYLSAESTARYQSQKGAALQETGLVLYKRYGAFPQVVGLVEGSPAAKAGIEIGDSLAEINGAGTAAMSLAEVNLYAADTTPAPVDLKILRDDKTLDYKVDRVALFAEPVSYQPYEGTGGILRVDSLAASAPLEIETRLAPVIRKQKKPVILDLRNCSGGSLEAAWQLINIFLKAESVGYIAGRGESKVTVAAAAEPALGSTALIVWVNQATLGPAEAVAAVLKDFGRARVVGLTTLGYVARDKYMPLEDGTSVLLTSGIFCLRSGFKLWGQGVEPDAKVESATAGFEAFFKKTQEFLSSP